MKRTTANRSTLHLLGDSHVHMFEHLEASGRLRRTRLAYCIVEGATAMGVANPNSKTMAGPTFAAYLAGLGAAEHRLFCLGEVDCGFVVWYRARKHHRSIAGQYERAVANYGKLLRLNPDASRVIVLSAPPPTILDGQDWGAVANLRRQVRATLRQRTDLTLKFNAALAKLCRRRGYRWVDVQGAVIDRRTRLVADRYRNAEATDHHLDGKAMAPVLGGALAKLGFR